MIDFWRFIIFSAFITVVILGFILVVDYAESTPDSSECISVIKVIDRD